MINELKKVSMIKELKKDIEYNFYSFIKKLIFFLVINIFYYFCNMEELFDIENGNLILKDEIRKKIISFLLDTYEPGHGNGKYYAVKYLKEVSNLGLKFVADIVESIKIN